MNILVLGLGNILLADEGVGVRAIEAFAEQYDVTDGVEVVDGGTAGMALIDLFAGRDHVVIVDALRCGAGPGRVVRLAGEEVPAFFRTKISPHQLGLSDVLATLEVLGQRPAGMTVIGIEPEVIEADLNLSPGVAAHVDEMVTVLADELAGLGCAPTRRAAAPSERAPSA